MRNQQYIKKSMQLLLVCGLTIASSVVFAADDVSATPYRPTVANPAELSAPGWLELESGWSRSHGGGTVRSGVPYAAKFAFDTEWGVMLGGELWAKDQSINTSGWGDTSLTLKHRIASANEKINFGVEAGVNLPTARKGLGSGKSDWMVTGIYSLDFAENWRMDANLGLTRQGETTDGISRSLVPWAASVSHGIGQWTLAGEVSGTHQSGMSERVQSLVAVSYAVMPRLVLDVGFSHANQGGIGEQAVFVGASWLAGKVR